MRAIYKQFHRQRQRYQTQTHSIQFNPLLSLSVPFLLHQSFLSSYFSSPSNPRYISSFITITNSLKFLISILPIAYIFYLSLPSDSKEIKVLEKKKTCSKESVFFLAYLYLLLSSLVFYCQHPFLFSKILMAVQAQYPSNILLLNRSGQERKDIILGMGGDYLQQGEFTHQNLMIDNGGVVNPRKRGREAPVSVSGSPAHLFSLQPQHQSSTSMLVNLSQLNNQQHQGGVVSTGLGLSLEDQQQQQQQQQQHHQQQQLGLLFPSPVISSLTEDISAQIKQQRDEIDQLLQTQRDQLRRTLADKRERHYRALLGAAEESASRRLKEKDAEVEKAARRNAELEERAAHLKAEAQVWQARARAQESAAVSLQAQLQQAMMAGPAQDRRDELGCAGGDSLPVDDAESAHIDPRRSESSPVPPCRVCRNRAVSVVLLPCRHLCICAACEPVVHVCPLCCTVRNASVEVYLS